MTYKEFQKICEQKIPARKLLYCGVCVGGIKDIVEEYDLCMKTYVAGDYKVIDLASIDNGYVRATINRYLTKEGVNHIEFFKILEEL